MQEKGEGGAGSYFIGSGVVVDGMHNERDGSSAHLNVSQSGLGRMVANDLIRTLAELGPDVIGAPAKP